MSKPLVCISSVELNSDNTDPSANHDFMTHLTLDSRVVSVIAVVHSQSVSLGDLPDRRPVTARRQLLLTAGFFTPVWIASKKSCEWNGMV